MINLRYHIVSITAVFLALGIGLAFGAAFIDRATVGTLDANLRSLEQQNQALEATNGRLDERVGAFEVAAEEFVEVGIPQLVAARLTGVPVLVIATRGVDEDDVAGAAAALTAAGATSGGVLWLTDRLTLTDDGAAEDLAAILGRGAPDDAVALRAQLVDRLNTLLVDAAAGADEVVGPTGPSAEPVDPTTSTTATTTAGLPPDDTTTTTAVAPPTDDSPDDVPDGTTTSTTEGGGDDPGESSLDPAPRPVPPLLQALLEGGFVELDAPDTAPEEFALLPAADARYLVVSGPGAVVPDAMVLVPLVAALTEDVEAGVAGGPVVVAAQSGPPAGADLDDDVDPDVERVRFVGPLRDAEAVRDHLSTVDDLEVPSGVLAVVLAMERGILGQFGHYGVGDGAQSQLPAEPPPTPGGPDTDTIDNIDNIDNIDAGPGPDDDGGGDG